MLMPTDAMTTIITTPPCPHCHRTSEVSVPAEGVAAHNAGALIQNAFPTLDANARELLMTGFHTTCWDDVFGDEDEG